MPSGLPPHSAQVVALLSAVEADKEDLLRLAEAVLRADEARCYPLDWMAIAAVKRHVSTSHAMVCLVRAWNMVCARTLLRTHIDTALRFSAAWLVEDPQDFAFKVLRGERIDRTKDKEGKKLTDRHIVEIRAKGYPWLLKVYEALSGYVHFSSHHITVSLTGPTDEGQTRIEVSESDTRFPPTSWVEVLECFRETTGMLAHYLDSYRYTKNMSPDDLAAAKSDS